MKKTNKLSKYLQVGGNKSGPPKIVAEKGEYVKDTNGEVFKVSDKMPTHDDTTIVGLETDKKVKSGKGGVELENVSQVLSSTSENRQKKSKNHTDIDESLRFQKDEAKNFIFDKFGLKSKINKSLSPSGIVDKTLEAKNNFVKKFDNKDYRLDTKYASNSLEANKAILNTLPELEDIFDVVFEEQESRKLPEPVQNFQRGGFNIPSPQDLGATSVPRSTFVHKEPFRGTVEPFPEYIPQSPPVSTRRRPPITQRLEDKRLNFPINELSPIEIDIQESLLQLPNVENPFEIIPGPYQGYERVIDSEYIKNPDDTYGQMIHKFGKSKVVRKQQLGGNTLRTGGIHIDPKNKGKFTKSAAEAGRSVQEHARFVLNHKEDFTPLQVKRANFARNAATWNKQVGGNNKGVVQSPNRDLITTVRLNDGTVVPITTLDGRIPDRSAFYLPPDSVTVTRNPLGNYSAKTFFDSKTKKYLNKK